MSTDLDAVWRDLVANALLGTDRRAPSNLSPGPLADIVADAQDVSASRRLLTTVAAVTAARRAATTPGPPVVPLPTRAPDRRPLVPMAAVVDWRRIVREWPLLEPEWLELADGHGWRRPPDVAAVVERRPALPRAPLPIPASLAPLLDATGTDLADALIPELAAGRLGPAHRAVLVNLLARCHPEPLRELVAAIDRWESRSGLASALADLGTLRLAMIEHLTP
jgi:hypothetical protein